MKRACYIDHLKMVLCALVIIHHTAIAYGALGGWCYLAPDPIRGVPQLALSTLLAVNQAFFMSLFFFISAYLMPESLARKGTGTFLKDRVVRLGIPLLVYTLLIHPSLIYGIQIHTHSTAESWLRFVWLRITQAPNTGHMWFVLALLLFECLYVLYRSCSKLSLSALIPNHPPHHGHLGVFVLGCSALAFALRQFFPIGTHILGVQLGYFGLYSAMYALGILARRKQWMDRLSFGAAGIWFCAALALLPFVVHALAAVGRQPDQLRLYAGGLNREAWLLSLWESVTCVGVCGFLWVVFRSRLNTFTKLSASFSANSYAVYVLHPVVVVGATMLFESIQLAPLAKFTLVSLLSIASCYLLAHNVRKLPAVRRVL